MTNRRREDSGHVESREYLDILCRASALAIAALLCASDTTTDHIVSLLRANGSLPTDGRESPEEYDRVSGAALDRLGEMLSRLLEVAIRFAVEDDRDYLRGLRTFYLEPRESYSIEELAAIWQISPDQVRDIFHNEIDRWADAHPDSSDLPRIGWGEAVDANDAFAIARAFDVERALGHDFSHVRAPGWRTVTLVLHLPRSITDAISSKAGGLSNRLLAAHVKQFILDSFMMDGISSRARAQQTSRRRTSGS